MVEDGSGKEVGDGMEYMELLKFVIHLYVKFYNYLINDVSGHYWGAKGCER